MGNGTCDEICNHEACNFDGGDCAQVVELEDDTDDPDDNDDDGEDNDRNDHGNDSHEATAGNDEDFEEVECEEEIGPDGQAYLVDKTEGTVYREPEKEGGEAEAVGRWDFAAQAILLDDTEAERTARSLADALDPLTATQLRAVLVRFAAESAEAEAALRRVISGAQSRAAETSDAASLDAAEARAQRPREGLDGRAVGQGASANEAAACPDDCFEAFQGDGACDAPCDSAACDWDGGDCPVRTADPDVERGAGHAHAPPPRVDE
jgi:hypothetical protein